MIKLLHVVVVLLSVALSAACLQYYYLSITIVTALCVLYVYDLHTHNYWKRKGISGPPPNFIFGHAHRLYSTENPRWEYLDKIYKTYKQEGVCGLYEFFQPALLIMDSAIVRNILITDFDHFTDRWQFELDAKKDEVITNLIAVISGRHWKELRSVISPAFSTTKIRGMFDTFNEKADDFIASSRSLSEDGSPVAMNKAWTNFTLDVIATCAFGIDLKSSGSMKEVFLKHAQKALPFMDIKRYALYRLSPKLFSWFGLRLSVPAMDYFVNLGNEIVQKRKEEKMKRGDFVDLLLDCVDKEKTDSFVTEKVISSQVAVFLLAGHGTTANSLLYSSFILAKYPEFQEKLRQEVKLVLDDDGKLCYEKVMHNKLLRAFINESLRLFPVSTFGQRKCTKTYRIPGTSLEIPEGMVVIIPTWSIQRDEKYWTDAMKFNPERFLSSDTEKDNMSNFLSFGNGPRNCIGKPFALMEMKVVLVKMLLNFNLTIAEGYEEIKFDSNPILLKPAAEFYLNMTPI